MSASTGMDTLQLYTHRACLGHVAGEGHPERPARLQAVTTAIEAAFPALPWRDAPRATRAQLLRVHDDALLARVLDTELPAGADPLALDPDTALGHGSAEAALHAAGAGVAAVDALMAGPALRAFCAVRPPGHHATATTAMGFCLFNNIAVAAAHACERYRLARVAVVDFDVHHGNGTEAVFRSDPRVMYLSSHQRRLFPGGGSARGAGVGNVVVRSLEAGTGSREFRTAWADHLLPALAAFRPQLLFVSAGFDAHRSDPLAGLQLEAADFGWVTAELVRIATRHSGGRIVSMLEGGYDLQALRECCVAHVRALLGES
jgi:acetoin utilization deacetylase AcuC-like enzyme